MLTLRHFDELGEHTREVAVYVILKEDRFVRIIYTPYEAICYDKQTNVIRFRCDRINEALERKHHETS